MLVKTRRMIVLRDEWLLPCGVWWGLFPLLLLLLSLHDGVMCLSINAEKGLWAEKVMFWSGLCLSEFLCHCGIQFLLYFKCVCVFLSFFIYVVRQLLVWMLETMVQNIVFETARDRSSVTWVDHFSALSTFFGRSWLYINSGISRMLYSL